jgi:Uma2 family endonuclease
MRRCVSPAIDQDDSYVVLHDVPPEVYARLSQALAETRNRHSYDQGTLEIRRVLPGVGPDLYRAFLEALGDYSLRHTYDGWDLELMSPRQEHEWLKRLIGRMVETLSLAESIPIKSVSSTTLSAPGFERGLQPDECYYVQREPEVRGRDQYDPAADPPPDLAIEVDVTSSSVKRLPTFAKLGVPEIWRHDGKRVRFYRLDDRGEYVEQDRSAAFPRIVSADLDRFLTQRSALDETSLVQAFVRHVRQGTA